MAQGGNVQPLLDQRWRIFLEVAQLGSLTRAASALNVPQPTISRQVSTLERECGTRLFRRTGRGVALTDFGAHLFPQLLALAADADRLADAIKAKGGLPAGEVRVGLLPSTVPSVASRLFSCLREQLPQVQLHLVEGSNASLEEQLREGRIDLALLLREQPSPDPDETVLTQTTLHLVGRRGDPLLAQGSVPLAALEGLALVVPGRPHPLRGRLEALAEARGLNLNVAVTADSIRLQHEIAASGGVYAVSSGLFEMSQDPRFSAAEIVKPRLRRSIVLAGTIRRPHTLASREVERTIVRFVPAWLQGPSGSPAPAARNLNS